MPSEPLLWSRPNRLARRSDPATAKAAGRAAAESVGAVQRWAAECVAASPGLTQRELGDRYCPGDLRRIGRRLPECVRAGSVQLGTPRRCRITGRTAQTYYPEGVDA